MNTIFVLVLTVFLLTCPCVIRCFEELTIDLSLKEEQPNGTEIVDLRSHMPSLNTSRGSVIRFVRPCPQIYLDDRQPFVLRALTIDREVLCPYERVCSIHCQLFVQHDEMKFIQLKINIDDINDHRARFRKRFYSYEIADTLPLDYRLQLEQAEDADLFSTHSYRLNSSSTSIFPFRLHHDSDNHSLELVLIDRLPAHPRRYPFDLIVTDGDDGQEEDRCSITVEIVSNEEERSSPPEFQSKSYHFTVSSADQVHVGQVHVVNSDMHDVYYRLIAADEHHLDLFQVDERTGEITIKDRLCSSTNSELYEIFVEAFYPNYLSSLTMVHVTCNFTHSSSSSSFGGQDHFIEVLIPKLLHKNSSNPGQLSLQENCSVPLPLLQLFVSSSSPSLLNTSLTSSPPVHFDEYFAVRSIDGDDQQSLELVLIKSFDYEIVRRLQVEFMLTGFESTRRSLDVIIENVNDCAPVLDQPQFRFQVTENQPSPLLLHTFVAIDGDGQLNNITYEMQGEGDFSVNATTGQLWTTRSLDREKQARHSLSICAFDERHRTCSPVIIDVLDENDNICSFNTSSLTLIIDENLPPNTLLTRVHALDADYGQNGTLTYEFVSHTSYLHVDAVTGVVRTTTHSFDYEFIQRYSTTIRACDNVHALPSLCCYLQLNIHLRDLDDNQPYLIDPPSTSDLFIINYTNKTMPRLRAFDNDIELHNRLIVYEIVGGSLNTSLTIDSHSGQLALRSHSSSSSLPLYGTLLVSLSSQTTVPLTMLVHDNHTDPQVYLLALRRPSSLVSALSSPMFYLILSVCMGIGLLICTPLIVVLYVCQRPVHLDSNPLMTTPSTTTLSARSLPTTMTTSSKRLCETYYSFGDTVHPQVIRV